MRNFCPYWGFFSFTLVAIMVYNNWKRINMNKELYNMLRASAEADIAKARLSLKLLSDHPSGIGDHSTKDFYSNAEEALALLDNGISRLETLSNYKEEK